jgi:hypothetical protein
MKEKGRKRKKADIVLYSKHVNYSISDTPTAPQHKKVPNLRKILAVSVGNTQALPIHR